MDLDQGCLAIEHIDLIVDGDDIVGAQIGLGDEASRNVPVGPFVQPEAIRLAQPFRRPLSCDLPVGRIVANDILVAAMARLQDEGIGP